MAIPFDKSPKSLTEGSEVKPQRYGHFFCIKNLKKIDDNIQHFIVELSSKKKGWCIISRIQAK